MISANNRTTYLLRNCGVNPSVNVGVFNTANSARAAAVSGGYSAWEIWSGKPKKTNSQVVKYLNRIERHRSL
jgi:hypothetical protein